MFRKKMKRLVFTIGLCLVTAVMFGQKKAVSEALKLAKDARPNFTEARAKISGALQHAETKDVAQTWFTAGQIENLQFDKENTKQFLGQQPNEAVMYGALLEIYPYFEKAYELDNLPDAKGKVKPKYSKDIKSILRANLVYYINGGIYFYEQENFRKAYESFDQYVVIADSRIMKESETNVAAIDSNYFIANYYAAAATLLGDDHATIIKAFTRASKLDYRRNDVFQYLADEYKRVEDTVNYEKTLVEGHALFPHEPYFLHNLVGVYINTERNDKALESIITAVQNDPSNAQLINIAGRIYESAFNDDEKAEEYFKKSIAIDGENAESQSNLGRIYYNRGVTQLEIANNITDVKKFNEEKEKALELFRKALPFYEKAFKLDSEFRENQFALRSIYYNLQMNDKYEEITRLMGGEE